MSGDAAIALAGNADCERDQFPRFGIEMRRLASGVAELTVAALWQGSFFQNPRSALIGPVGIHPSRASLLYHLAKT
jgi:hypothetical protein